jgi:hypothetical protein
VPQPWLVLGAHTPCDEQADHVDHVPLSHVRVCVPQWPQAWELAPLQVWPVQSLHWQLPPHVCVPPDPQVCTAFGAQAPSSEHAAQSDQTPFRQVRDCVPQLPQACEVGPSHATGAEQVPQWQLPLQTCVPPPAQAWVAFGAHSPWVEHVDQLESTPFSHVRRCVPQLAHAWRSGADPQPWFWQAPHVQLPAHVRVPLTPQASLVFGAHAPSPLQSPQSDQVPFTHSLERVPQLPHASSAGPEHA